MVFIPEATAPKRNLRPLPPNAAQFRRAVHVASNGGPRKLAPKSSELKSRSIATTSQQEMDTVLSAAEEGLPGEVSLLAPKVEEKLRQQQSRWFPPNLPKAAGNVRVLKDADFEARYAQAKAGGNAENLSAFIETMSDGTMHIWVREGAENERTVIHELLHAYASPKFKLAGQSFVVDRGREHSDLSEGVVQFLTAKATADSWQGPPTPEAEAASTIFDKIGSQTFFDAVFGGDEKALSAFSEVSKDISGIAFSAKTAPNSVETMMSSGHELSNLADVRSRRVKEKATAIADQLLAKHKGASLAQPSPLAGLSSDIRARLLESANMHVAHELELAKGSISREVALQEVNKLAKNTGAVKGIAEQINLTPSLQKTKITPKKLAQVAAGPASKELAKKITTTEPALGVAEDNVAPALHAAVDRILPQVLENLVRHFAESFVSTGPAGPRSVPEINGLDDRALEEGTLARLQAYLVNAIVTPEFEIQTPPRGSFLGAAGAHAAANAAKTLYAGIRPDAKAAASAGALDTLKEGMSHFLENAPDVSSGPTLHISTADMAQHVKATQANLWTYAHQIATRAVDLYKQEGAGERVANYEQEIANFVQKAATEVAARNKSPLRGTRQQQEQQQQDEKQKLSAAERIVLRAILKNEGSFNKFATSASGGNQLVQERMQLLGTLEGSIKDLLKQTINDAQSWIRRQPDVMLHLRKKVDDPESQAAPEAAAAIKRRIVEGVIERNFVPNPASKGKVPPALTRAPATWQEYTVSTVAKPFMKSASYSKHLFLQTMAPFLSKKMKTALESALNGNPDRATLLLSLVPEGLAAVIADIHAHFAGYDRRVANVLDNLLNPAHPNGRTLCGSIPQYCGGAGHYSGSAPAAGTMENSIELDERTGEDWLKVYNAGDYRRAARADLSITGVNFAPNPPIKHIAFTNPVAYIKGLLRKAYVDFVAMGELTGIKEMVSRQMGRWRWNAGSETFQDFLSLMNETGQVVILHNDWGDHTESAEGRPAPAKQNYENLDLLKFVFSNPKYQNVQVVFAHTGIGRFVRPNDKMTTRSHDIKTWTWDPATGTGRVTNTVTKEVTAPEHIHQIYDLFEAVPNARVDISWNDVTQAYMDMMHSNPDAAEAIVQLFMDHQDRILFGSDTVKPVNPGHYNQALMTGAPLFMKIIEKDIANAGGVDRLDRQNSAAFKILRGNYDAALELAYDRVYEWKRKEGVDQAQMDERRNRLIPCREDLGNAAWAAFQDLARKVSAPSPDAPDVNSFNPGVFPELYRALPESTHLEQDAGSATGIGTSGGSKNDSTLRQVGTAVSAAGIVGTTAAAGYLLTRVMGPPSAGGGFGPALTGSTATDVVNDVAFLTRAALGLGRIFYTENLRLEWEKIFEQGAVTRDGLDRYVSRLLNGASSLGITAPQIHQIGAATEQFWANYTWLRDKPLNPEHGWTEEQRFLAIHAEVGKYQITVSRILTLQDSSIDATDARRLEGKLLRALVLATYGINVAVAVKWLMNGGWSEFRSAGDAPDAVYRLLFMMGNAMLGTLEGTRVAAGFFGITDLENSKGAKVLQIAGTAALTLGGGVWAGSTAVDAVHSFMHGDVTAGALQTASAIVQAPFSFFLGQGMGHEINRATARPMQGPRKLSNPQIFMLGALGVAMCFAIAEVAHVA